MFKGLLSKFTTDYLRTYYNFCKQIDGYFLSEPLWIILYDIHLIKGKTKLLNQKSHSSVKNF